MRVLEPNPASWPIEFPGGGFVSRAYWVAIPLLGKRIAIPPQLAGVVRFEGGRVRIFTEGDQYLNIPAGRYAMQFVKLAKTPLRLNDAVCVTRDGCNPILGIQVDVRVLLPASVVNTPNLGKDIETALRGAVNDYTRDLKHPDLIQEPGGTPALSDEEVAREIATRLRRSPALRGVELVAVSLLARSPDRIRWAAIVEKATIAQERDLETERTDLAQLRLTQEAELLGSRRDVAIGQAAIERSVEEERYQVALAKAAIDAQAGAARRSLLEQELEFA
ncbi:MAG: hypothetical protein L0Z70_02935, partial [Chloroflexi bacterium]|nr:hypothetical protein [Chloroflexota bacterium]